MKAAFRQWWHCFWRMGHQAKIGYGNERVVYRACSCGRVFYEEGW